MTPKALLVVAAALVAVVGLATQDTKKAPDFTAKSSEGKQVSLKALAAKGPVYLYFIKSDCPVNARAFPFYQAVYKGFKKPVPFLGVINEDADGYKEWNATFQAPFPVVFDREMSIITGYEAERSPWVVEVRKGGEIGRVWQGYSKTAMEEVGKALAAASGQPVPSVDLSGAPSRLMYG